MRYLAFILVFIFLPSCLTKSIIPTAIGNGARISIKVQSLGGIGSSFYEVNIEKKGEEYELVHLENNISTAYKVPANKLELLSEMEMNLKALNKLREKYFCLTISSDKKSKSYNINTDIMHDFISGLKKK